MKLFHFLVPAFFALMKSTIQICTMQRTGAVLVLFISLAPLPYIERSAFADDAESELLPVLQGQPAIDYLVTNGLFDGLTTALAASRPDQPSTDEKFNFAIAIGGETAVIGARQDDGGNGAGYVFELSSDGQWSEIHKLVASDGAVNDQFGGAVALHGNKVFVGAWGKNENKGSVYFFNRNQNGAQQWGEVEKLVAADGQPGDRFGNAVVLGGKRAFVGAFGDDFERSGVYLFQRDANQSPNWSELTKLTATSSVSSDKFNDIPAEGFQRVGDVVSVIQTPYSVSGSSSSAKTALKSPSGSKLPLSSSVGTLAVSPDPYGLYVKSISYGGSGCLQGSVGQSFSNDRTTFTEIFDQFIASTGSGVPITEARKNCQMNINLHIPQGWQYSIATMDYRGYAQLQAAMTASQRSIYYFGGEVAQVSAGTNFIGPVAKDYLARDTIPIQSVVWSSCTAVLPINVNAQVRIIPPSSSQPGQITTDSIDGKIKQIQGFHWKSC